jgi:biopolymer transport protein ExbB/TolQ
MILGQSLFSVFKNSIVMVILLASSILAVGLILERFWYFFRNRFNPDKGLNEFQKQERKRRWSGAAPRRTRWAGCSRRPLRTLL